MKIVVHDAGQAGAGVAETLVSQGSGIAVVDTDVWCGRQCHVESRCGARRVGDAADLSALQG